MLEKNRNHSCFWMFLLYLVLAGISGCAERDQASADTARVRRKLPSISKNAQLIKAAQNGNLAAVQTLLADGADIHARDTAYKSTPLMWAADKGHPEVAKLLLENGADINRIDSYGRTALKWAKIKGRPEIVKLLKEYGAKE